MEEMKNRQKSLAGARRLAARGRARRSAVVMAGAGALAMVVAGAASAGASEPAAVNPGLSPAGVAASGSVAGYNSAPDVGFASASATLVVPKLTCTSKTAGSGQFFGLFDTDPTAGTTAAHVVSAVNVDCGSSGPTYDFFTFVGGNENSPTGIKPGDTVVLSLVQTASTELATVADLTTKETVTDSNAPVSNSSIDIGADSTVPTEQFAKATFTKVQVNGQYLDAMPTQEYNLLNGAKTLIKTSAIASPGDSFSLTFKHSS
jgi:hypothetical protein